MTPLASLCLALACLAPQDQDVPPIQETPTSWILNFAQPEPGKPDTGMSLAWFVAACEQATGINFTYSDETSQLLEQRKIRLLGTKEVPKEEFYSFFQMMMIINDFVCSRIGPEHLSVVQITSLKTQERASAKNDAIQVDPEDLDLYADQPATLIMTVVHLPNTDVRQLSNSMRTMFPDPNTNQLLPAGSTNSMIVTGFGSNVVAMVRMLKLIDEASQIEAVLPEFAVIPLEFVSAIEIQTLVEELLDASVRAATARGQQVQQAQGATGMSTRGRTETKIMVDERTNSLLVMSMPEDMPRIKELVAELDVDVVARERNYHIYNLENVEAEALAEVLNEFLEDATRMEQEQGALAGQPGGAGAGPSPTRSSRRSTEFVVVPDEESNSLLIAANATRYAELQSLIQRLDRRQAQVLIETALIELSGHDFLDIGAELGLADIPESGEDGGFGLTSFGLSTLQDTDGDGVPDVKVPNQANGITAGILDGDDFSLPVLISLLQERRQANVLNVPSVLVNNNGFAKVETKDLQPTTQITLGGVGGQTQENFDEYVEAGVTMEISPSISARNYLRLDIFLRVSTFLGAVQGAIPPPKNERTIETVVNVPDGDTMVIGGIVVDNTQETRRQVPWLGDIPIIGYLFGRNSESLDRTALYFFVTPHIMRDLEFADLAQYSYSKKLEAADTIGADRVRQIDPRFGADESPIDLRGFDVPLYSSPRRGEVEPESVGLDDPVRRNELLQEQQQQEE